MRHCWKVRATQSIDGLNAIGQPATLKAGQIGWMPHAEAVTATLDGRVEMLSPGGIAELRARPAEISAPVSGETPSAARPRAPRPKAG